jgi:putative transposase
METTIEADTSSKAEDWHSRVKTEPMLACRRDYSKTTKQRKTVYPRYHRQLLENDIVVGRIRPFVRGRNCQILIEASQYLSSYIPDIILVDGGSENRVEKYGDTLQWAKERMRRALVDIAYSNSMIEAFWRKIKYSFLFKYNLDSLATVKRLIEKFINRYITIMPHSAFRGQTPDEIFFGNAPDIEKRLVEERTKAREKRIEFNRALSCDACNIDYSHLYSSNERGAGIELQN